MITENGFIAAVQSVPRQPQAPYFREAGSGTSVVCIHSSASSVARRGLDFSTPRLYVLDGAKALSAAVKRHAITFLHQP